MRKHSSQKVASLTGCEGQSQALRLVGTRTEHPPLLPPVTWQSSVRPPCHLSSLSHPQQSGFQNLIHLNEPNSLVAISLKVILKFKSIPDVDQCSSSIPSAGIPYPLLSSEMSGEHGGDGNQREAGMGEQEACLRTPQIQRGTWLHSQKDAHASPDQELQHCQTQKAHDPMATEGVRGGMAGGGQ